MVINFDRELGLRCSKNESCSKWHNEACGQPQRRFGHNFFFWNSIVYYFFFLFFYYFSHLFLYL